MSEGAAGPTFSRYVGCRRRHIRGPLASRTLLLGSRPLLLSTTLWRPRTTAPGAALTAAAPNRPIRAGAPRCSSIRPPSTGRGPCIACKSRRGRSAAASFSWRTTPFSRSPPYSTGFLPGMRYRFRPAACAAQLGHAGATSATRLSTGR
jgi:hypothetical protein